MTLLAPYKVGSSGGLPSAYYPVIAFPTPAKPFISRWDTTRISTGSSASNQVTLPLVSNGIYSSIVKWGDGSEDTITAWDQPETTHTYAAPGVYTITIEGVFTGIQFNQLRDRLKILNISQFGVLNLGNTIGAQFRGCSFIDITATDILDLTGTPNLSNCFRNCFVLVFNPSINNWDWSGVTNTNLMFNKAFLFNQPLNRIDSSNFITSVGMLQFTSFDQDISSLSFQSQTNATQFLNESNFSKANYDPLLISLDSQTLQNNVPFSAGTAQYSAGAPATARANIIANNSWVITDGGQAP